MSRARGKRDYKRGLEREDNPYCGYTNQIAYEEWQESWDSCYENDQLNEDKFTYDKLQGAS